MTRADHFERTDFPWTKGSPDTSRPGILNRVDSYYVHGPSSVCPIHVVSIWKSGSSTQADCYRWKGETPPDKLHESAREVHHEDGPPLPLGQQLRRRLGRGATPQFQPLWTVIPGRVPGASSEV